MKNKPSFLMAALGLMAGIPSQAREIMRDIGKHSVSVDPVLLRRSKRGKSKGGHGGSGMLKKVHTRQPDGYYSQSTPIEHMHACARRRALEASAK